ncbi:MAG TPA: pitrilysin family protein, partial [Candidatus Nanoarchaeia archaeon]|nr:pitrilysin family protein [Candidatus Nanoarchaeia archaeon]
MKRALLLLLLISCTTSFVYEEHTDAGSKYVLPNGMTLLLKENHDTGMVAIDVFVARSIASDGDLHGLSNFANRMLLTGTEKRTREDITNEMENAGGSIGTRTYVEFSELTIQVPSESFSTALEILQDVLLNSNFSPEEVEKERILLLGELNSKKDQPPIVTEELFMKTLYQGHPYQDPPDGYATDVERITREDLIKHYQDWYVPGEIIISISGNIDEKKTAKALAYLFGDVPAKDSPELTVPFANPILEPRKSTENFIAESYFIQTGYLVTPAVYPDFIPLRVMSGVLGLGSGSRLFYELRDKRALAYSLFTAIPSVRSTGFIKIVMTVRPEALNASIDGLGLELIKLKSEPVPKEELDHVKQKM